MALKTGALRQGLAVVALALLTTACSDKSNEQLPVLPTVTKLLVSELFGKKQAEGAGHADQFSRAELAAVGSPIQRIRISKTKVDTYLILAQRQGEIATWTDGVAATFTFRSGVLIETRGLGGDLMSASVPSPSQLLAGGSHRRVYFTNGAEDRNDRRDLNCTARLAGNERIEIKGRAHDTRLVVETCDGTGGQIENRYWFEGGSIRKSLEWLSPSVGYVGLERVID